MNDEKPFGMRVGESVFCIGYLAFALAAALVFFARRGGEHGGLAGVCATMTLLLGCGDAFHLVPRIVANVRGAARDDDERLRRQRWIGLGNLVSSVTMTAFYVPLFDAAALAYGASVPQPPHAIRALLVVFAAVRIALCLFPQNRWFDGGGSPWNLYRNLPFVAMGFVTASYLLVWYRAWLLSALVTASFACYMAVVLLAPKRPVMGMLMIPKTVCYIWMLALFLARTA